MTAGKFIGSERFHARFLFKVEETLSTWKDCGLKIAFATISMRLIWWFEISFTNLFASKLSSKSNNNLQWTLTNFMLSAFECIERKLNLLNKTTEMMTMTTFYSTHSDSAYFTLTQNATICNLIRKSNFSTHRNEKIRKSFALVLFQLTTNYDSSNSRKLWNEIKLEWKWRRKRRRELK